MLVITGQCCFTVAEAGQRDLDVGHIGSAETVPIGSCIEIVGRAGPVQAIALALAAETEHHLRLVIRFQLLNWHYSDVAGQAVLM